MKILIIGNKGGTNIGSSFERAALKMGLETCVLEPRLAMKAPWIIEKFNWCIMDRRPTWFKKFSKAVLESASEMKPEWLLSVGAAPIDAQSLGKIGSAGTRRLVYLTDDPWNPAHRAEWFLKSLPFYDSVFTPREVVMDDLKKLGCKDIRYLPFGYDPELFYPVRKPDTAGKNDDIDIFFAGSCDRDRIAHMAALINGGFKLALYGSFWPKTGEIKKYCRGQADPETLRLAIGRSKVSLCLVRRSNRDGNSMRSFEVPASGGCMLVEDTPEHKKIFGPEGEAVVYFKTIDEMIQKTKFLLGNSQIRSRLASASYSLITGGCNTYQDRLSAMLGDTK